MKMTPKCVMCGNRFTIMPQADGIPVMLGFVEKNGNQINMCKWCMTKLGRMTDEQREMFFVNLEEQR